MPVIDKKQIIPTLSTMSEAVLDIGCGPLKKKPEWIGVDIADAEGVDIVGDIFEVLALIPDGSLTQIYSSHFLEHIPNLDVLLNEMGRVLKKGGIMTVIVPHFSNPYYYSDYTHKNFFGLYSFSYLARESLLTRKVPRYQNLDDYFNIESIDLIFKSPFRVRGWWYKFWGKVFNMNYAMKEFYEENCTGFFHCYELAFKLRRS